MTDEDVKRHMNTAMEFRKEGEAYVHAEYKNGENPLIVAGDGFALIRIIERMTARLAQLTNHEFGDVIEAVEEMHDAIPEELS